MNFLHLISLVSFVIGLQETCSNIYVRKSFTSLSSEQQNLFWKTFVKLSNKMNTDGVSELHRLTQTHILFAYPIHFNPFFLVWHRRFTLELHNKMKEIEPNVEFPYWDWLSESSSSEIKNRVEPHNSPVMKFFFGNGSGKDNCVEGARELNITSKVLNGPKCLQRKFDRGDSISPFSNKAAIQEILNESDYGLFSSDLEEIPHSLPHINIGGDMRLMSSPNDPLFWLHHGMIDLLFSAWQKNNPNGFKNEYTDRFGSSIFLNTSIPVFKDSFESTLDTTKAPYCYTYDNLNPFGVSSDREIENDFVNGNNIVKDQLSGLQRRHYNEEIQYQKNHMKLNNSHPYIINPIRTLELEPGLSLKVNLTQVNSEQAQSRILSHICPLQMCPSEVGNYPNYAIPNPIPEEWLKENHYPINLFRDQELRHAQLTFKENIKFEPYKKSDDKLVKT